MTYDARSKIVTEAGTVASGFEPPNSPSSVSRQVRLPWSNDEAGRGDGDPNEFDCRSFNGVL